MWSEKVISLNLECYIENTENKLAIVNNLN